ncbi:recombinase family protein [Marinospirillum sp. MEB164]|uniref:Recombinase family protein n=1 Tax=Marinospirillum alkalitolerans TaxID=3123374 RepID=A0ABW8PYV2_9GAMM
MTRTFAYCRVSTTEQTTENQVQALKAAGYDIQPNRIISETISGSVQASQRPEFARLLDKLEHGDSLIVLKLDRLGRDNIDIQQTITSLQERGISVQSLDLPKMDIASSSGRLMLQMFSAFAEFERNRIRERTAEGLERAKAEGKKLGRPEATSTTKAVQAAKAEGLSQSKAAAKLGLSIPTIKRHWNKIA